MLIASFIDPGESASGRAGGQEAGFPGYTRRKAYHPAQQA